MKRFGMKWSDCKGLCRVSGNEGNAQWLVLFSGFLLMLFVAMMLWDTLVGLIERVQKIKNPE